MKAARTLITVVSLVLIAGLGFGGYKLLTRKSEAAPMTRPPANVTVALPVQQSVVEYREFTGTTESVRQVEIRARVEGVLEGIHFADGADVQKGDLLFEIEPELYQARRDRAEAAQVSAQAELDRAQVDLNRIQKAAETNAISQQDLTTAQANLQKAQAAVLEAQAALTQAELDLSYTRIVAPMSGRITRRFVDQGNLVGAGEQTLLARIVQLSPLYVTFYADEAFFLQELESPGESKGRALNVGLGHETGYPLAGALDYIDNTVDTGTGTVLLRGELPNGDKSLLPGMFVRLQVPLGENPDTLLVQDMALSTDIGGKYLLLVNDEDKVERCPVTVGRPIGDLRVVLSGLKAEDRYIVKGLQSAVPGSVVAPQMQDSQ